MIQLAFRSLGHRLAPLLLFLPALLVAKPAQASPGVGVRLLFPILQGNELERLLPLAPDAQIVTVAGSPFIQLGHFSDARVAHRLGRSIQRRVAIPFDLAYDPGYPQTERALRGTLWAEERPAAVATSPAVPPQPAESPALRPGPAPTQQPPALRPRPSSHPWLRPVAIAAQELGVPITRAQPAANVKIDYLYVRLRQPADLRHLQAILPVQELVLEQQTYLARVGVFTRSRQGRVLMAEKVARLRQAAITPIRIVHNGTSQQAV